MPHLNADALAEAKIEDGLEAFLQWLDNNPSDAVLSYLWPKPPGDRPTPKAFAAAATAKGAAS